MYQPTAYFNLLKVCTQATKNRKYLLKTNKSSKYLKLISSHQNKSKNDYKISALSALH